MILLRSSLIVGLLIAMAVRAAADIPKAQEYYKQANQAYRLGQYEEAVKLYQKVLEEEPSYADYMDKHLGSSYLKLKDEGKALFYLKRALHKDPLDKNLEENVKYLESRDVLPDSSAAGTDLQGTITRRNHIFSTRETSYTAALP